MNLQYKNELKNSLILSQFRNELVVTLGINYMNEGT